ncbi:hypothetical protein NQ011_06300 [Corynebacterium phoceense]|uniref:hypothetical protein n=1 Tax=Corynebacterium phoceense TaxID=1686286 RepID=UPI00211CDF7A|nr:hypothetical protein [Corynebacterium phoceense]MCQ9336295.1 hypothetical protein [Corynebacterium phoceense]
MRNFRTAAVAAATAVTVAFGGTAIASAETGDQNNETITENQDVTKDATPSEISEAASSKDKKYPTLSSKLGAVTDNTVKAKGTDLLGKEVNDKTNPQWAKIWRDGTYALIGTSIAGALIAAYNFAVYNHILPNHILDPMFNR